MKELIKTAIRHWLVKKLGAVNELTPELRAIIIEAVMDYIEDKL